MVDLDTPAELVDGSLATLRVFAGYAGWGAGQLEDEMTRHGWFACPGTPAILFDTPTDERWAAAFKTEGIDPRLLASETGAA